MRGRRPSQARKYGKLWGLYLTISGIDPFGGPDYKWPENKTGEFIQLDDITRDIDSPDDYHDLQTLLRESVSALRQKL